MQTLTTLDRSEVLRYLGWKGSEIPAALEETLRRCIRELCESARPAWVYRRFSLARAGGGLLLSPSSLLLTGNDIAAHLSGCGEVFLLCATIGLGPERQIGRASCRERV